jgi:hypothetical protein
VVADSTPDGTQLTAGVAGQPPSASGTVTFA